MRGLEVAAWGQLGADPELRTSKAGKPFCSMSVAVTTGADDDGKPVSTWVKLVCFGQVAEDIAARAKKQDRLYFEGSLSVSPWQTKTGEARVNVNVAAWLVQRLGNVGKHRQFREKGHAVAAENHRQPGESQAEHQLRATDFVRGDPLPF